MLYSVIHRNIYSALFLILAATLLAGCSSDDGKIQINIEGIWSAYWYDDSASVDHLIIDKSTESGDITGRWYDAEDKIYYPADGTINDHNISINVKYAFAWNMTSTLNSDNSVVTGNVAISGTNSILDATHPLRLVKVN